MANVKPTWRFIIIKRGEGLASATEAVDNTCTRSLKERVSYTIAELEKCSSHTGVPDFRTLLDAIHAAATDDLLQGAHRFPLPPNPTRHRDARRDFLSHKIAL